MRWFDGDKMLLEVQYSTGTEALELVRIAINAERNDEDVYQGSYSLELFSDSVPETTDPEQLVSSGDASCSAE
jgi:hypothetical protein